MALLQNVIASGTHAARPAAGSAGVLYWETDTFYLFRDSGTVWEQVAWPSSPPSVRCHNSTDPTVTSATSTALTFDTNDYDQGTSAQHSTSSNTSRLTCQVAGIYAVVGCIEYDGNASGIRYATIRKNGTGIPLSEERQSAISAAPTGVNVAAQAKLAVGDYVELVAFQNSGSTLTIWCAADGPTYFGWTRVG